MPVGCMRLMSIACVNDFDVVLLIICGGSASALYMLVALSILTGGFPK